MSELPSQLVEELEALSMDPEVRNVLSLLEQKNKIIKQVNGVSESTGSTMIGEIDSQWSGLLGKQCMVTGYTTLVKPATGATLFFEEEPVIFNGAAAESLVRPDGTVDIGGLGLQFFQETRMDDGLISRQVYFMRPRDVGGIEFNGLSVERSKYWLQHYFPEQIDELDFRLLGADTDNEVELLLGLSDMEVCLDPTIIDRDENFLGTTANALSIYTNHLVQFDSLPYVLDAHGDAYLVTDQGLQPCTIEITTLTIGHGVRWLQNTNEPVLRPYFSIELVQESQYADTAAQEVIVPPRIINSLDSVRKMFR